MIASCPFSSCCSFHTRPKYSRALAEYHTSTTTGTVRHDSAHGGESVTFDFKFSGCQSPIPDLLQALVTTGADLTRDPSLTQAWQARLLHHALICPWRTTPDERTFLRSGRHPSSVHVCDRSRMRSSSPRQASQKYLRLLLPYSPSQATTLLSTALWCLQGLVLKDEARVRPETEAPVSAVPFG